MELKCPPPPPPPPIPPFTSVSIPLVRSTNLQLLVENSKENTKLGEQDLEKAIEVSSCRDNSRVFYVTNTFLQPQFQEGPTCGLVALSIASSISQKFITVKDIFQEALSKGFTKQGEMFSVQYLAYLAEKCCKFNTRIISGGINNHLFCILQSLLNKNLLLIPYDCDVNHFPCLKNGAKAHWAVISGFVIMIQSKDNKDTSHQADLVLLKDNFNKCDCETVQNSSNDGNEMNLVFFNFNDCLFASKKSMEHISSLNDVDVSKVYLIGLQGKSRHFGIWDFKTLAASNNNLMQFSDDRDSESYVLPTGGLEECLKGQAIILGTTK